MNYKQNTSIVVLGALAITLLYCISAVGSKVDIGRSHIALADTTAAPSPFRHFITNTPPNKTSNTTITTDSNSIYSIPSTFVKIDKFSANYTIAGRISSISASRDLITSTIVNDFDKNPNIGYVVNNSSSLITPQPGLPNPFVNMETINRKITNEAQNAITATSMTNPTERNVNIKCTFGMILADYKCG